MADYLTMAVIHILVGFEVIMFGFLNTGSNDEAVEALLIIAVLLLLPTVILVSLVKAGDLAGNIIATCFALAFAIASGWFLHILQLFRHAVRILLAAVLYLIGSIVWCDKYDNNSECPPYTMTLHVTGSFLVGLGGVFLILLVASGGSSKSGPA